MVDNSDNIRSFLRDEIFKAVPAIPKKNKRSDGKAIIS